MQTYLGFKVAVISRDSSKLDKLKGFVSPSTKNNLTTLVGNVGKYLLPFIFATLDISLIWDCLWLMKYSPNLSGSEEGVEEVKQALVKSVGKITDVVSSLGFSWWQGGPPHTQPVKELQWVREQHLPWQPVYNIKHDPFQWFFIHAYMTHNISPSTFCFPLVCFPPFDCSKLILSVQQVIETLLFSTFVSWKAFFPLVKDDPNCTYTLITGKSLFALQKHVFS